jgi:TonB family protein
MRNLAAFALLLVLAGCGTPYQVSHDIEPPDLIAYAPLPPFSSVPPIGVLKLKLLICVREDGTVDQARLLNSSGDAEWDSLAEHSILLWRYAPPLRNGVPTDVWIHQQIVVQFEDPIFMSLSRLSASSRSQADSLYDLLVKGADFDTLVRDFAAAAMGRNGYVGRVDIRTFVPRVVEALRKLHEGEFTRPLRDGDSFVIYKRLAKEVS